MMPSILARDNRHLFLERNDNKGNSFVAKSLEKQLFH